MWNYENTRNFEQNTKLKMRKNESKGKQFEKKRNLVKRIAKVTQKNRKSNKSHKRNNKIRKSDKSDKKS